MIWLVGLLSRQSGILESVVRTSAISARARLVPAMRYRNVAAAIDWLSAAFGFSKHRIVTGDDGAILYGLLTFGDHMIMVWPVRESDLDRHMKQPDEIGGAETQTCYLVVEDADIHYDNAKAAGAEIVLDIKDHDDLGRGYSCRDPEGHIWHFGTYDPWPDKSIVSSRRFPMGGNGRTLVLFGGMVITAIGVASAGWMLGHVSADAQNSGRAAEAVAAASRRAEEMARRSESLAAERAQARSATVVAEGIALQARDQLRRERAAKEVAERNARVVEEQLALVRHAKESAERAVQGAAAQAKRQAALEREAKERAERTLRDMIAQLAIAERAAREAKDQLARVQDESTSNVQSANQERHSGDPPKEVAERSASNGAALSEAIRARRVCSDILGDAEAYDPALVRHCLEISRK